MSGPDGFAREDGAQGGRWVFRDGGVEAEMTYTRPGPDRIIIDHTGVPDAFRGKGVGLALVRRMVADARAEGLRVESRCSFVTAQARKHPDWADVIE